MASKKCPKCGEDNPAEAVMCWACYTPLSGGPAMAGAGLAGATGFAGKTSLGQGPVGVPDVGEAPSKKAVDPKLIGLVAFLLIGAVVGFLINGGMSSTAGTVTADTGTEAPADPEAPPPPPVAPPPPLSVAPSDSSAAAVAPVPVIFSTVTSPNPKFETGTVGILVPPNKSGQAASSAKFVRDQLARNGRWTRMQVVVFTDSATAEAFRAYQGPRGGQPLSANDYRQLATQGVWANTPAFLESSGKKEVVHVPSSNPNGWWGR